MSRSHNYSQKWITAIIILAVAGIILIQGMRYALFALLPAQSGSKDSVIVEIHKSQRPGEIAQLLSEQGVVSDRHKFMWLGRLARNWSKIKAGEYRLSKGMSPTEVFAVITSGISIAHPVTVREGENIYEIADDLQAKGLTAKPKFLALCRDRGFIKTLGLPTPYPPSLEGYLFPDTYFFNRSLSAQDMIRQMFKRLSGVWNAEQQKRAQELGMTEHQVLTLASIIEKETGVPNERPMISSVFHNRLKKRMRLASDPTTIYGIWEKFDGNLHREDLNTRTPYNTYTISGLPVGPIANPGFESIAAALHPAESDFLFFVSHNDGTTEFTRTYEEHMRAVRRFQQDPRAREGKSWRDYYRQSHAAPATTPNHR